MVLKQREIVESLAPHYGVAASAVIAAASTAAAAAQQAAQRRAQQNAAQAAKQGSAASGSAGAGSGVASSIMGGLQNPDIQKMIQGVVKPGPSPIANAASAGAGSIQQLSPQEIAGQGQSMQQAFGGQQPDLQSLLSGINTGSVGGM